MSREAILSALAARLSAKRAPWPEIPDLAAGEAFSVIADGPERVIEREYDRAVIAMEIDCRRAIRHGADLTRSTAANALLDAFVTEIYGADKTLGGACLDMEYVEGDTIYPTDGTDLVAVAALFSAKYERPE